MSKRNDTAQRTPKDSRFRALFENLRDGASIEEFLTWFPGVRRDQVQAVLDHELATLSVAVA